MTKDISPEGLRTAAEELRTLALELERMAVAAARAEPPDAMGLRERAIVALRGGDLMAEVGTWMASAAPQVAAAQEAQRRAFVTLIDAFAQTVEAARPELIGKYTDAAVERHMRAADIEFGQGVLSDALDITAAALSDLKDAVTTKPGGGVMNETSETIRTIRMLQADARMLTGVTPNQSSTESDDQYLGRLISFIQGARTLGERIARERSEEARREIEAENRRTAAAVQRVREALRANGIRMSVQVHQGDHDPTIRVEIRGVDLGEFTAELDMFADGGPEPPPRPPAPWEDPDAIEAEARRICAALEVDPDSVAHMRYGDHLTDFERAELDLEASLIPDTTLAVSAWRTVRRHAARALKGGPAG